MSGSVRAPLKVVFGNMTFGDAGVEGVRTTNIADANAILDLFQSHGHKEIDSARVYGGGTAEAFLAKCNWQTRGLVMDTKLYPTAAALAHLMKAGSYTHSPEDVRRGLMDSLKALGAEKIDMWYLHGPDRSVPLEDTLREVNNLYKEGYFKRFGISNYMSWEVAKICEICKTNGYIMPSVYQGVYNALQRSIEAELFPCLRHYGIALYAFQPLAGGFLTSRYKRDAAEDEFEEGSRFDPKRWQGRLHRGRYWNDTYFDGLEAIREVIKPLGITEVECALRWMNYHSAMSPEFGDAVIVGASSTTQLESNLVALEQGPLPDNVVEVLEAAWLKIKGPAPKYFH
ncbi:putative aldo keto reductase protein [Dipodascopsis tothii]|uniref:putative aldo keto reductase protein n=1 Tax=Dipodascopsis tothii TaxID=44089 RepID=UPI0034CE2820